MIENIDLQFKERPIPNFYALAGKSARVDIIVRDGDTITLEERLTLEIIRTAGHSADGVSYRIGDAMFIGDAVPVDDLLHCFNSDEYKAIMNKRIESVDARGLIIEA